MANLRELPKIDVLRRSPKLQGFPDAVRTQAARAAVETLRQEARNGQSIKPGRAEELAEAEALRIVGHSLKRVINASGVVLHTGLGRARLADEAAKRVYETARSHSAVELDLDDGKRGDRQTHVRGLLCELTGAEDALVVNNCAAAVFLTLNALCSGLEVILSRGQMVEIGGSFRMPDIVRRSGCKLVEVGCTNKTRVSDYEEAITDDTAAILRCHPSNFKMVGFTEEPDLVELRSLATSRELLLLDDLGSGCLVDTTAFSLHAEPRVQDSIKASADVVTCSGDKMLGGPQAGIIVGRKACIAEIKKNPLARAVRIDKLTLSALEATLRLYVTGRQAEIPIIRYLSRSADELKRIAMRWKRAYRGHATVDQGVSEVGGGSLPGAQLPTWRLGIFVSQPEELARDLRLGEPSILARIERDAVWLDPRTVEQDEAREIEKVLSELKVDARDRPRHSKSKRQSS